MDQEIEVPSFFLCPISLDIMKDPVTISTGITYDRASIEKWLFSDKKKSTCPVTKLPVTDTDLTPNHTLRRLIQSWCTLNASHGVERIPTPKPPISKSEIEKLIKTASSSPQEQVKTLKRLRLIMSENATNRRCIEAAGVPEFLASLLVNGTSTSSSSDSSLNLDGCSNYSSLENGFDSSKSISDEALILLHNLQVSESGVKKLLNEKQGSGIVESLTRIVQRGTYESRAYATQLLKTILDHSDPIQLVALKPDIFIELVQILHDQTSQKAIKSALQILIHICGLGRNRHKAIESGAVPVLIEILLENISPSEKRIPEMAIVLLEILCQCAEGRLALLNHGAGIAVVSKKILRVSHVASERAVRVLLSIGKSCATTFWLQEMMEIGVVAKLILVLQVDSGGKTKEKARELLKLHARVWKNSPCLPRSLMSCYPS